MIKPAWSRIIPLCSVVFCKLSKSWSQVNNQFNQLSFKEWILYASWLSKEELLFTPFVLSNSVHWGSWYYTKFIILSNSVHSFCFKQYIGLDQKRTFIRLVSDISGLGTIGGTMLNCISETCVWALYQGKSSSLVMSLILTNFLSTKSRNNPLQGFNIINP